MTKFIQYFYEKEMQDENWIKNYENIVNKKIEELTYEEVLTSLTAIIRGDRFITGNIYSSVKNGEMLSLIERLYNLVK